MNEHSYQPSNFQSLDSAPQHRIESQMSKCLDVCAQEHQSLALWPQKWWHPSKGLQASVPSVSSWLLHISSAPIKQWARIKRHEAEFVSLFMLKVEAEAKEHSRAFPRGSWLKLQSNWVSFKTQVMCLSPRECGHECYSHISHFPWQPINSGWNWGYRLVFQWGEGDK